MSLNNVLVCQERLQVRRLCGIILANNVYHVAAKRLTSLVRIGDRAKSVLELFLLRLDAQGLDISSQWGISGEDLIVGTLWPKLYATWLVKSSGQVVERLSRICGWHGRKLCLAACAGLGNAEPVILSKS
jgi:hypothetical protein